MNQLELINLINHMSIKEKIGELVLLGGNFFADDLNIITGPKDNLGIDPKIIPYCGVVGNIGIDTIKRVNERRISEGRTPVLVCADVIHGYEVAFPNPLALASSMNYDLIKKSVSVFTREAYAHGINVSFAPMLDLSRDPRWGRVMESFGEDPYLGSIYAKAFVKGMQGNLKEGHIGSTVKHFAGYSLPEGGRDYQMSTITPRMFNDYYLPAYEAGIKAGSLMVMSGFNSLDYVPISMNKELLTGTLRKKIGFKGCVISDYNAIHELVNHRVAKDDEEAALLAFKAGIDIDLMSACYPNHLEDLLKKGKITMEEIDEKVLHVLKVKNALGLFENPNRFDESDLEVRKDDLKAAYSMCLESMVLLKNNNCLPLKRGEKILFLGDFVSEAGLYSSWSLFVDKNMTSVKDELEKDQNHYYQILDLKELSKRPLNSVELNQIDEAIKTVDQVVLMVGENEQDSGEAKSKGNLSLSPNVFTLLSRIRPVAKKITTVVYSGRALVLSDIDPLTDALIYAFLPGTMGSKALIDLLYGKANFSAKLSISLPYSVGQIPVYYQALPTGRPFEKRIEDNQYYSHYLDQPNTPLYSFGDGLSYSHFVYSNLNVDKKVLRKGEEVKVSVTVLNDSKRRGKEIVLLYVTDELGSVERPNRELKSLKKIDLLPGEKKTINLIIKEKDLRFTGLDMKKKTEPGEFTLTVSNLHTSIAYQE